MSSGSIKNDITAGMFIDPFKYQFNHSCWPLLIKHMIIRKLNENPDGLSIFELKTKMIQNENISIINIAYALKSLIENQSVSQHQHLYKLTNFQNKRSEEFYIDNNDNKSNVIDQQSDRNDVMMSSNYLMDTDDDNDWKTQTHVFTNFEFQYRHKHPNQCWIMPDNNNVGDKWWNFRRIINIRDDNPSLSISEESKEEEKAEIDYGTEGYHQQIQQCVYDKQKNKRNRNRSANHAPEVSKIMYNVAMNKVANFMQKYKYELNGEEKRDIPCLHIQNGDGFGKHPKIPYSKLSLGQSLILRTGLLYSMPIDKLTDKLQCKSDLAASRVSELTNSGEIKNTMIQLRSHTLHTINATRKATYFALISHNNNDDHESLYSKAESLLNTQYLDTFGPETDIYNHRFVPIFDNKICIILKSLNYDIYTNKIEPKIAVSNEYKCEWIGSLNNLKMFMSSEKDYKYIKQEVQEWIENYTVYLHYLRILNKEKAYKCLVNKHFKGYDWNNHEIGTLQSLFAILLKCDTNTLSS